MPRIISLVIASAGLLSACSGSSGNEVAMVPGRMFDPRTITVQTGETVMWVNDAGDAHTVTAYGDSLPDDAPYFSSGGFPNEAAARDELSEGLISNGGSYQVTFDKSGTYQYFCIPHEADGMKGTVVVEE